MRKNVRSKPLRVRAKSLNPLNWTGKMKDIPVFLLGNAPSLNDVNLLLLNDYFTIGMNRIFFKYDPTILIWQDLALWIQEKKKIVSLFIEGIHVNRISEEATVYIRKLPTVNKKIDLPYLSVSSVAEEGFEPPTRGL
ncbi:MAG: hypothetical protein IIB95_13695 [Candidatus Marinimicrobia bacterium]|nr:hypothetical protein [Candidatus Neomarinimicrobiota bacterium]